MSADQRAAAHQDLPAVDFEKAMALRSELRSYFPHAELQRGRVGNTPAHFKLQLGRVQFRLAHLVGPPQPRLRQLELGILLRREADRLRFRRAKFNAAAPSEYSQSPPEARP